MYGVRFNTDQDEPPATFVLVTDRAPIWGSFMAKAGRDSGAYNVGWGIWGDYLADTDIPGFVFDSAEWVPVPDSFTQAVPEPATVTMAGISSLTFAGLAWARQRKKA